MQSENAEKFYADLIKILLAKKLPFMVGGTYALSAYTGIERPTKDIDFITTFDAYPKILKTLSDAGYKTELYGEFNEGDWIAKVKKGHDTADVIYAERNGLEKVDKSWLKLAREEEVLGQKVKLVPVEEMIRSKAYIQHKERFDGSDVINLMLKFGKTIDWKYLQKRMEPNWEILFAHIVNFIFVYPNDIDVFPKSITREYIGRLNKILEGKPNKEEKITRGLLISSQYDVAVKKWGYKPISPFFNNLYEHREKKS
jgi:hypothetical protein